MSTGRATASTISWGPIGAAVAISGAVLALGRWGDGDTAHACSLSVTTASLVLPAIAGVALDDTAWELTASSPRALWTRRLGRVAAVIGVLTVAWLGILGAARLAHPRSFAVIDVAVTSARAAAIAAATLAVAALLARFRRDHLGLIAAGILTATAALWNELHPVVVDTAQVWPWLAVVIVAAAGAVAASHEPLPR